MVPDKRTQTNDVNMGIDNQLIYNLYIIRNPICVSNYIVNFEL